MKLVHINFNNSDIIIFGSFFFISFLLFLFYVNLNADINYYDEFSYLEVSQLMLENGFEWENDYRTYLYPTITASIRSIWSDTDGYLFYSRDHDWDKTYNTDLITTKIIISVLQYAVYLGSVIFIANSAVWKNNNKIIWHSVIAFGFLNPFLIQATTLFLTDILASCFMVVSIFSLIRLDLNRSKFTLFAIGLFYASVMIRPSAVIFLPIVVGIILFRILKKKNINLLKVSLISLALLVIFMPQLYQNVTKQGEWTPLITVPLYEKQISWATTWMKAGTVVIPGESAPESRQILYSIPFPVEKNTNIYQLLLENPSTFIQLYFSHIFGVLDWDYVDTYIKEYYPLNRIPSSLLIYSTWFFAICGIFSASKNFFIANRFLLTTLIISAFLYLAFIATTLVELRMGYPIFLLLLPFSGYGVKYLFDSTIHNNKTSKLWIKRIGFITVYSLFISTFFYISFLFSYQTGRIDWFGFFNL